MDVSTSLQDQAYELLATLAAQCSVENGESLGSMSSSVYDSAWLSMLQKPTETAGEETMTWLFPECFEFVLAQQLPSGAWESYATPVDGILNTAAALLSMKKHLLIQPENRDLLLRCQRTQVILAQILTDWDTNSTDQVGQEILVISLLDLLEKEGILIESPRLTTLRAIRHRKLAKIAPQTVYHTRSTLHHSLEAFIGHIDFDGVRSWREENGSMMNSPASTAAYLMYSSTWDNNAEAYLKTVVNRHNGIHCGGVPCAWPTAFFEISWVITTLTEVGLTIKLSDATIFGNMLQDALQKQHGLLGFARGILSDVDDTAKGLQALHVMGYESSVDHLIKAFESDEHFLTYVGELNPSISANCNVLILLLTREDRTQHISQIVKVTQFLIKQVYSGQIKEKWHQNELYWIMLLAHALKLFYQYHEIACVTFDLAPHLREHIPMILLHSLMRIMHIQQLDGSWDNICETTSYGILALSSIVKVPFVRQLDTERIISAINLAKSYLHANRGGWNKGHYMWIEKVTYSSDTLSRAYCLAASIVPTPTIVELEQTFLLLDHEFLVPDELLLGMRKSGTLLSRTPLCFATEAHSLRAAELQACFALQSLQRDAPRIFPRTAKGKDKYTFLIPLTFTVCAESYGCSTSVSVLYEMMVLSILNFHVDEYMEGVVEENFGTALGPIRNLVQYIFTESRPLQHNTASGGDAILQSNGYPGDEKHDSPEGPNALPSVRDVSTVLHEFVKHILDHPAVLSSPAHLQMQLASELQTFLLAHISDAEDNNRFRRQLRSHDKSATLQAEKNGVNGTSPIQFLEPGRTFYKWVHSTSADHTSCPFSFVFFNCLLNHAGTSRTGQKSSSGILASARTAYIAEDACRHLSRLCRIYNDIGSLQRDVDEEALNSLNFPEFFIQAATKLASGMPISDTTGKTELLWIADHERRGLKTAMELLEELLHKGLMDALHMFVDVTDLYGQIYVLKDVGTRTQ